MTRAALAVALAGLFALALASSAGAQDATWRLEQPNPPDGVAFKVPLGAPGDFQCFARNRCLLSVEGNGAVASGLFYWNGASWRQLSTVCGGSGDTTRIAFAGPTEFWTITSPSLPRTGAGTSLCRFKDGRVADSFSTAASSPDPYKQMNAGSCRAPDDCWFGGGGERDPTGSRVGAFHLRWNGSTLRTVYNPQGRGVTDIEASGDGYWETTVVGKRAENREEDAELAAPEDPPRLLHRLQGDGFANDPFVPLTRPGVPPDGSELLAVDTDGGGNVWAGGGGAASGTAAKAYGNPDGTVTTAPRGPLAVKRQPDGSWQEQVLTGPTFDPADRLVDVAAIPGGQGAWAALQPYAQRRAVNVSARVALIQPGGATEVTELPASGAGRGSAAKVHFTAPNDGWLVTQAGWIFHYTDGQNPPVDTEGAFQRLINTRRNEAAEQFVSDRPPPDDSRLFAPPPVTIEQTAPPTEQTAAPAAQTLPALLRRVKSRLKGRRRLVISFTLVREAKIGARGIRKRKVVAKTKAKVLKPGKRSITLKLNPKRYPTRVRFSIRETTLPQGGTSTEPTDNPGDTITR